MRKSVKKSRCLCKKIKVIIPVLVTVLVFFVVALVVAMTQQAAEKTPLVCLDAGHGGQDVGAIGKNDRYEKDDNLRVALLVRDALETRGIRVLMTRDEDVFISLEDRCKLANRKKADLFVALHRNSAESGSGVEIWVLSTEPQVDTALANSILAELESVGISKKRGVRFGLAGKTGNYYVNSNTKMPSCLVELGFITSDADNALFDEKLAEYASAIADGIEQTLLNNAAP